MAPISNNLVTDEYLRILKSIRLEAGLTQSELSKMLNKPQSYVSKYETGERKLQPLEVVAICKATNSSFVRFAEKLENLVNKRRT